LTKKREFLTNKFKVKVHQQKKKTKNKAERKGKKEEGREQTIK